MEYNLFFNPCCDIVLYHGGKYYASLDISMLGDGNVYRNPLFIRTTFSDFGNYQLQPGSPAIDTCTPDGAPAIDLGGKPRPLGETIDMRAYQVG